MQVDLLFGRAFWNPVRLPTLFHRIDIHASCSLDWWESLKVLSYTVGAVITITYYIILLLLITSTGKLLPRSHDERYEKREKNQKANQQIQKMKYHKLCHHKNNLSEI